MSSILKALRKLENDKSTGRPDALKIDAKILQTDHSPRFSSLRFLATSLLLVACGSFATYIYMKLDKTSEILKQKTPVISRQHSTSVLTTSDITTERLPDALVVNPSIQTKTTKADTLKSTQPPSRNKTALTSVKVAPRHEYDRTSPSSPLLLQPASSKPVPILKVNGIAFQNGGAESAAMVNGVAVSKGSVINGVKIEEIHKNRVIFNYNEVKFEIQLGQSNQ